MVGVYFYRKTNSQLFQMSEGKISTDVRTYETEFGEAILIKDLLDFYRLCLMASSDPSYVEVFEELIDRFERLNK